MTEQELLEQFQAIPDTVTTELAEIEYSGYVPDSTRVFYHSHGHFHGDYSAVVVDFRRKIVTVKWAAGLAIELRGQDALRFLKLNRSRHAAAFETRKLN